MPKKPVTPAPIKILRRSQVEQRTGLGRTTIYRWIKDGNFPKPVKLCGSAMQSPVGWIESEVDDWIKNCITHRDHP